MKLKMIALAVTLAITGTASAAALDPGTNGNGSLMLNVWNTTGSYTLNLGYSLDSFASGIGATGNFNQSFGDAGLTSFLSGSTADLKWNVLATDNVGARRVLSTFSTTAASNIKDDSGRSAALNINQFAIATKANGLDGAVNSITVASSSTAYAGKSSIGTKIGGAFNFDDYGIYSNNSYDNGIGLRLIDSKATGIALSKYTTYADGSTDVKAWIGTDNQLHIAAITAAVPEPETYALLLAGLGLMGTVIRRRNRNV